MDGVIETMTTSISFRSNAQRECYERAVSQDEFLIAAKPRFGKTYTGCKIVTDGWKTQFLVIMSGMNVRNEWKNALELCNYDFIITTNEELNELNKTNIEPSKTYAFFVSTQKAGMNLFERDPDAITSQQWLVDAFNAYKGVKTIIFDECHFAEQTARTKNMLELYKYNKLLYLSGTPYTCSIKEHFTKEQMFTYTYAQEMADWRTGTLSYTPIQMRMYILDRFISLNDEDINEGWDQLFKPANKTRAKEFLKKMIAFVDNQHDVNNLIFVRETKQAVKLVSWLNEIGVDAISAAGSCDRVDSVMATNFYLNNPDHKTKFIVTCQRLGTGCTIEPLQSVIFCCPTTSAIKFIQNSMRACSPWEAENKQFADVICFNKFNGFGIYNTVASLECRDKQTTNVKEYDFKEFEKDLPLFITEDGITLREVDYIEATSFEDVYVHGKTKLFTDIDSLDEFTVIFDLSAASLSKVVSNMLKDNPNKAEATNRLIEAFNKGGVAACQEELNKIAEENGVEKVNILERVVDKVEEMRSALQKLYINVIEHLILGGLITVNNSEVNVVYDAASDIILEAGFKSLEVFKDIIDRHPEYVRCINKHVSLQMTNNQ